MSDNTVVNVAVIFAFAMVCQSVFTYSIVKLVITGRSVLEQREAPGRSDRMSLVGRDGR